MNNRLAITLFCSLVVIGELAFLYACFSFAAYADTQAMRETSRQRSIAKCDAKGHKGYYIDERGEVWCTL